MLTKLEIDHVTLAARSLDTMMSELAAFGLQAVYGGEHGNGATHMAVLGMDDGSYLELIATLDDDVASPVWEPFLRADAGPCAWSIRSDAIGDDLKTLSNRSFAIRGPVRRERKRPDGNIVEWYMGFVGEHGIGAREPFLIEDVTPRSLRVQPSPSASALGIVGIDTVILGVDDVSVAKSDFETGFGLRFTDHGGWGSHSGRVVAADDGPVIFVEPENGEGWIANRLAAFGPCPCGYLIGVKDIAFIVKLLGRNAEPGPDGRDVVWCRGGLLTDWNVGFVQSRAA